jgi:hypothetical protein
VGDDAVTAVEKCITEAERKGRPQLAERLKVRKERGQEAFQKAFTKHINNASACAVVVCDSTSTEGYQYGSRS